MLHNETAAIEYYIHKYVGGPGANATAPCDADCRQQLFCETTASEYADLKACLHPMLGATPDDAFDLVEYENKLNHDWYKPRTPPK